MRGVRGVAFEAVIGASRGERAPPGLLARLWRWIEEQVRGHR